MGGLCSIHGTCICDRVGMVLDIFVFVTSKKQLLLPCLSMLSPHVFELRFLIHVNIVEANLLYCFD